MPCDNFRAVVLDVVSNQDERHRLAKALSHIETCPDCQSAFSDFDKLAQQIKRDRLPAKPAQGWNAFDQQLMKASAYRSQIDDRISSSKTSFRSMRKLLVLAISIVVVAGAAGFPVARHFVVRSHSRQALAAGLGAQQAGIDPAQVIGYTTAFEKVSEFFDRRAEWMLVSNSAGTNISNEMGLSSQSLNRLNVVVLRLSMFQSGNAQAVSSVDLVIVPGESADLTVQLDAGHSVHYRVGTTASNEAHLALLAEIKTPAGDVPLASLSTTVDMKHNAQISVGELETSAGRYELRSAFSPAALPARG